MIPKVIHYCWFGGKEKPLLAKKCIASWKKFCPDYQIIEWNESNFDIHMNPYTEMCCEQNKYAFLSDYARLVIIQKEGGIYFDTDVEVVKPLDDLLDQRAFFGFENDQYVATGLGFGAEAGSFVMKELIREYDGMLDGQHGTVGCPLVNTKALERMGLIRNGQYQTFDEFTVYPTDYFNPYDDPTGRLRKTKNTYSIHWYAKSWISPGLVLRSKLMKPVHRIFGTDIMKRHKKT